MKQVQQDSTPAPVRGAVFYTAKLLLLALVGTTLQRTLGAAGSIANQLLFSLGLAIAFAVYGEHRPVTEVLRLRSLSVKGYMRSAVLGVTAVAFMQALGALITLLVERSGGTMLQYYNLTDVPFALALIMLGIVPPICEEIAYRGYLQQALAPLGPRAGVAVTALLFAAMHGSLIRLVPLALLGLIFGVAVQRSGSIVPAIIMHLLNNTLVLSLTYFATGLPPLSGLGLPILLTATLGLGLLVGALVRSFGPGDLAGGGAAPAAPPPGHALPRLVVPAMLLILVPAMLMYAYTASAEIVAVFLRK